MSQIKLTFWFHLILEDCIVDYSHRWPDLKQFFRVSITILALTRIGLCQRRRISKREEQRGSISLFTHYFKAICSVLILEWIIYISIEKQLTI
ncbi:hypothetical protein H8356DRAFT_1349462 [Neocallimastix lanati (nom. inval.)]|nr:hypothetical protein H8356DRAFT_1349462 [Neocallimastix sp. JGI-2020a]